MKNGGKHRGFHYANLAIIKAAITATPEALGGKALRREFARRLVGMRGVPMKMAQILSMSEDDAAARLQREALKDVPASPVDEILDRLRALAPGLRAQIEDYSEYGIAASLGQVHRIRLRDGRVCALKMKHPDIGPAMDLDAELMEFLVSVFGRFKEGFAIDSYKNLLTDELKGELDYPYEINRQARLHREFPDGVGIIIPLPYPLESGEEHLLMAWEESTPISEFAATATGPERREALSRLEDFHIRSLFRLGMAHADPNPGNFGMRRGARGIELVVYDFGSVIPLEKSLWTGLVDLLRVTADGGDPLPVLVAMGFQREPLHAIADRLQALCGILLEPFLAQGGFRIADWDRRRRVTELLGAERWNLMVAAPPAAFFLMRAMHGLFHYGEMLGGVLDLRRWLPEILSSGSAVSAYREIPDPLMEVTANGQARTLRVKMARNGIDVVSVTMPANCVERLDQIMDPELLTTLRAEGIEVMDAAEAARCNGYKTMDLFTWSGGNKSVRIWLE